MQPLGIVNFIDEARQPRDDFLEGPVAIQVHLLSAAPWAAVTKMAPG